MRPDNEGMYERLRVVSLKPPGLRSSSLLRKGIRNEWKHLATTEEVTVAQARDVFTQQHVDSPMTSGPTNYFPTNSLRSTDEVSDDPAMNPAPGSTDFVRAVSGRGDGASRGNADVHARGDHAYGDEYAALVHPSPPHVHADDARRGHGGGCVPSARGHVGARDARSHAARPPAP